MKLIKEYDIPDDGDCNKCKSLFRNTTHGIILCKIHGKIIWFKCGSKTLELENCQSCKDWLKQQKESKE